ncbi:putative PEP-binding protein, partial [Yoonia sp.]|uniref:putative PEP-binding protein n=1 Tax=Yoonia sp. TaxID=2212373 RepID=UPI0026005898
GRTSHAAIVSRELGLPAVVGCGEATHLLHDGQDVTVSCAGGEEGIVTEGISQITMTQETLQELPQVKTKIMLNLANPSAALRWWRLPVDGVGLARMEFVINAAVKVHPMALVEFDAITDSETRDKITALTAGYDSKPDYFVDQLSRGLSRIAAFCYPKPVIVRMSDFKTNEYAELLGGRDFEPHEENPMIGFRGASRYYSPRYQDGFSLECQAIARLRGQMGFDNVVMMIPFCRTPDEADRVLEVMAQNGLERGRDGLQVYMMCEIPANVIRAAEFAERFDGFSIGSNDLTQLTLGIDRDSDALASLFREDDPAVLWMIETVIRKAHEARSKVGFCGQAPSNDPRYAQHLVGFGIDSISVTPDSFVSVLRNVAKAEAKT